jgi:Icc-related predicted phosphoesterase
MRQEAETMKLLLFSDLHCSVEAAQSLLERSTAVDVLVGAGDFAHCRRGIQLTLDVLRAVDRPAVLVPGNAETLEELRKACEAWPLAQVLHGSKTTIEQVTFFGLGGAVPITPFGSWSYDLAEEEARPLLANCPPTAVLVTHAPPQGVVDRSARGIHLGSFAVRETIHQKRPLLAVCGHIHDCAGQVGRLRETPVVNAGPEGIVWDLETASVAESAG